MEKRVEVHYMVGNPGGRGYVSLDEIEEKNLSLGVVLSGVLVLMMDSLPVEMEERCREDEIFRNYLSFLSFPNGIPFYAVDKREKKEYRLIVKQTGVASVETPYGLFLFHLKKFNRYGGARYKGMKMFELEPFSVSDLDRVCLDEQFFFIGS